MICPVCNKEVSQILSVEDSPIEFCEHCSIEVSGFEFEELNKIQAVCSETAGSLVALSSRCAETREVALGLLNQVDKVLLVDLCDLLETHALCLAFQLFYCHLFLTLSELIPLREINSV